MREKFREWYAKEVQKQLANKVTAGVDLKMSTMKPLGAHWLVQFFDHIKSNNTIVQNGFKDIANFINK